MVGKVLLTSSWYRQQLHSNKTDSTRETMESTPEYLRAHRKHFIPLESNPEVFTKLIHKLGVSDSLEFQDVLSLDDPELLAFLPRPAYALVLVFPTTEAYHQRVKTEDSERQLETDNKAGGDILFFKQTINNACGLYGILHAVCNGEASTKLGM
jgi:ubiquitin carboxyl-terminal hydrolase L3